jgi:hypothetical protein
MMAAPNRGSPTACHDASDEIWTLGRLLLSRSSNEQALQIELLAM